MAQQIVQLHENQLLWQRLRINGGFSATGGLHGHQLRRWRSYVDPRWPGLSIGHGHREASANRVRNVYAGDWWGDHLFGGCDGSVMGRPQLCVFEWAWAAEFRRLSREQLWHWVSNAEDCVPLRLRSILVPKCGWRTGVQFHENPLSDRELWLHLRDECEYFGGENLLCVSLELQQLLLRCQDEYGSNADHDLSFGHVLVGDYDDF